MLETTAAVIPCYIRYYITLFISCQLLYFKAVGYADHLWPQFWHIATVLFLNLVLAVSLRLPTSNHKPQVHNISINRPKPHRHPIFRVRVFPPTCSTVTFTFSLLHLGQVIACSPFLYLSYRQIISYIAVKSNTLQLFYVCCRVFFLLGYVYRYTFSPVLLDVKTPSKS